MLQLQPIFSAALTLTAALFIHSSACAEPLSIRSPVEASSAGQSTLISCTPTTVRIGVDRPSPSKNPIADALTAAAPGCRITLSAGRYPGFTLGFGNRSPRNSNTSGGLPGQPITIVGMGDVWIRAEKDYGDTISINQKVSNGHITFENLKIEPGYRAAVLFFKQDDSKTHDGFKFLDCHILGNWDHAVERGKRSKWGLWGHSMSDFEFRGVRAPARVENIQQEHGFYIQNAQGSILLENIHATRLGRTFCQFTARAKDGPIGVGAITVRNCDVSDIGLFKDDNHKGGSAFTFAGRLTGDILVENNKYRAGFDPALARLTRPDVPYGTGALVCWTAGEKVKNRRVLLKNNDFEFAEGCGDRPLVSIGGCDQVAILAGNRFVAGGREAALALDPLRAGPASPPISPRNGRVYLAPDTTISGRIELNGRDIDDAQLEELKSPPARDERAEMQRGQR